MPKKKSLAELDDLFAQTVSYEIAITAILQTLARTSPAIAESIQKALAANRLRPEVQEHPKLVAKVAQYESVIEDEKAKKYQ